MLLAINEARKGLRSGGIPIGSVLVHNNQEVLGQGYNKRVQKGSSVLHGEMDALESAGRQSAATYSNTILYTTLSPCSMCSGAILLYGIPEVIIGENVNFKGEEEWLKNRGVKVKVLQDEACIQILRNFIHNHPGLWREDIGE